MGNLTSRSLLNIVFVLLFLPAEPYRSPENTPDTDQKKSVGEIEDPWIQFPAAAEGPSQAKRQVNIRKQMQHVANTEIDEPVIQVAKSPSEDQRKRQVIKPLVRHGITEKISDQADGHDRGNDEQNTLALHQTENSASIDGQPQFQNGGNDHAAFVGRDGTVFVFGHFCHVHGPAGHMLKCPGFECQIGDQADGKDRQTQAQGSDGSMGGQRSKGRVIRNGLRVPLLALL
ncbi:MAG: hypothetical protein R3236_07435, partial [Phycisphaeraceae bacterium]|nr:hypothetical protein [Phycisphaeraceae bacterium]